MNNAETNTLQIKKDGLTDAEWRWLVNNWDNLIKSGKYIFKEMYNADKYPPSIETSSLIEVDVNSFKSKEDYLEFRDIDEEVLENQIVKWFYSFRCENNCSGSVYKTGL